MGAPVATGVRRARPNARAPAQTYELVLYVSGDTEHSRAALSNLSVIAHRHLEGRFRLEIVDVRKQPDLARELGIVAMPMLVKRLPAPLKRLVGDLADEDRVVLGLDLLPARRTGRILNP